MHNLPVIIDLEASGFGMHSYPVEVGVALSDGKTACYLIQPRPEWTHWDPASEQLHGLTREILHRVGRPVSQVAAVLNELLAGQVIYSDAWGFDQTWLGKLYDAAGVRQQFRVEALQTLFSEQQYETWNHIKDGVLAERECERHRASNDAQAIQLAWQRMLQLDEAS